MVAKPPVLTVSWAMAVNVIAKTTAATHKVNNFISLSPHTSIINLSMC
jgi:hypothetical protein